MEYAHNSKVPVEPEEIREHEQRKLEASESIRRERNSKREKHKKPEGYDQHPADERTYEVFGLKNSFDNLSVSSDDRGRMTLAVSSQRSFHGPTHNATRKKLRGSRRRTKYEHWGEFYTAASNFNAGAFAFRTRKNLPEHRILREFKGNAYKYVGRERLEALPFLTLDEDREYLSELRSRDGRTSEAISERMAVERTIVRKTELENRFIRKLRIARRQTYVKPVTEYTEPERITKAVTDGADANDAAVNGSAAGGPRGTGVQGGGSRRNSESDNSSQDIGNKK